MAALVSSHANNAVACDIYGYAPPVNRHASPLPTGALSVGVKDVGGGENEAAGGSVVAAGGCIVGGCSTITATSGREWNRA